MTLFIDNFSEQNNCQIFFLMAELNELLFNSDSDDESFMGFEVKYIINSLRTRGGICRPRTHRHADEWRQLPPYD